MSSAQALKKSVLDYYLGGGTPTPVPTLLDFKILTTQPSTSGSSVAAATIAGIANNLTNFPAAAWQASPIFSAPTIQKTHTLDIHMKNAVSYTSQTTGAFAVYDNSSGQLIYFSNQSPSVTENMAAGGSYIVLAGVAWFDENSSLGMSAYLQKGILDAYLGGQALPASPGTLYISLLSRLPNPVTAGDDTGVVEALPSRTAVANNATNFPAATLINVTGGATDLGTAMKLCAAPLTFATNTGADAVVSGYGIYDAPTAGNLLFFGGTLPFVIPAGATHTLAANKIKAFRG